MPINYNDQYILYVKFIDKKSGISETTCIVYTTLDDAEEAIKLYRTYSSDKNYEIKLIKGEIIDTIYKMD